MTTYVALLRGVNVGGNRKTPMAELRQALAETGFGRVRTYIQSGNVVVDSGESPGQVGDRIGAVIAERFGHTVPVMVRTAAEMDRICASDPFAGRGLDESKVTVTFLSGPAPGPLEVPAGQVEEAFTDGAEVWVYYPEGLGKSTLDRTGFWKGLGDLATTTRNRRTVTKLRDMAAA
jgi:uncharacterized protein (DUF1697 family)